MAISYSELEHRYQLYRGLVEVSALMNKFTELEPLLQTIMATAQRVMGAEASSLMLADPASRELEMVVATSADTAGHAPPPRQRVPPGRGLAGWVFQNAVPLLVEDAYADDRFFPEIDRKTGFRTRCVLGVPLLYESRVIGVLQVLNPVGREVFSGAEQEGFEAFATLAAAAIERNRLLESEQQRHRLVQELTVATEIQESFLPRERPRLSGAVIDWHTQPAREIGGDFLDVYPLAEDECYFVIGDVSGKGVPAALLMAQAMSMLRLTLQPGLPPLLALERWNTLLLERIVRGTFITAVVGRLCPPTGRVELASAGHCPPVVCRAGTPEAAPLFHGSPPLGIMAGVCFEHRELLLAPGDALLLYTDGVTETQNPAGDFLDRSGLISLIHQCPPGERRMVEALVQATQAFRQATELSDDLTMLLIEKR